MKCQPWAESKGRKDSKQSLLSMRKQYDTLGSNKTTLVQARGLNIHHQSYKTICAI